MRVSTLWGGQSPIAFAVVFAVALAIRLVHVWQIRSSPFFYTLIGDGLSYDTWARQIASGDWIGRDVFYQTPLYPYFLGTLYALGSGLGAVRVGQAFIGAASCVLLAYASGRFFGARTGLVAGVMLAIYAPAVFFDGLIQKPVLDVFFICLALALLADLMAEPMKPRRWLALGLTLGALALTRENALLFVIAVPAWAWIYYKALGRARFTMVGPLLLGAALLLLPVAARNAAVGGGFHLTTSQFGPNFYIGNGPRADGGYVALVQGHGTAEFERTDATQLADHAAGRSLSPGEVSTYWTREALGAIAAQPLRWIALEGRKFRLVWSSTETMDTESQDAYVQWSTVLRVLSPLAHFGILAPLALLGIWITRGEGRRLSLLYVLLVTYTASVLVFYVLARYRYPMVPFLIIFAAAAIVNVRTILQRPFREIATGAALLIAAAVFCNWPSPFRAAAMRAQTYVNLGAQLVAKGDISNATLVYARAVEAVPASPDLRMTLGALLVQQGQAGAAIPHLAEAVRLRPEAIEAEFDLAIALNNQKRYEEAVEHYRSIVRRQPHPDGVERNLSASEINLGAARMTSGDLDGAMELLSDALRWNPASAAGHYQLGMALLGRGAFDEATAHLAQAVRINPSDSLAHYGLANAHRSQRRLDLAMEEYRRVIELLPNSVAAHNELGITLGSAGRLDEAAAEFREALRINPDDQAARNNLAIAAGPRPAARP